MTNRGNRESFGLKVVQEGEEDPFGFIIYIRW